MEEGVLINTTQLECFLAVSQHLNFSKAAYTLQMSQPAVSHQIKSLEEELDTPLFYRNNKQVKLTLSGEQFISDASAIMDIYGSAMKRLQKKEALQHFSIGYCNQLESTLFPPIFNRMKEKVPNFHPSLKLVSYQSVENSLANGAVDLVFGIKEFEGSSQGIHFKELAKCPVHFVCHSDHLLAAKSEITFAEMQGAIIISAPHVTPLPITRLQNKLVNQRTSSDIFTAESYENALTLVKSNLGFTLLPAASFMKEKELCYIPIKELEELPFGLYYKQDQLNTIKKDFLDATLAFFKQLT